METDLQIKIYDAECEIQNGTKVYRVNLPPALESATTHDQVKQFTKMQSSPGALAWVAEQKKQLAETGYCKIATLEYPLRWASGGLMYIVGNEILTVKKDFGSSAPSRLSLLTGISKSQNELYEPALTAAREGLEECVMIDRGVFEAPYLPFISQQQQNDIVNNIFDRVLPALATSGIQFFNCKAKDYNKQRLEVYGADENLISLYNAALIWLPEAASLDIVFAVEPHRNIKSLNMYDTEEHNGELIKRDFVFVPIDIIKSRQKKINQELYVKNSWKDINGMQQVQTELGKLLMNLEI